MNFNLEKDKEFLILMPYYNRPEIVCDALNSIKNQPYKNWKLAFIDDGSDDPGELIVKNIFDQEDLKKVYFYNTFETKESKSKRREENPDVYGVGSGGLITPFFNRAIKDIKSDVVLFLCDDDMLTENYLSDLNNFYKNHTESIYSYCDLILFDRVGDSKVFSDSRFHRFHREGFIHGFFNLDTCQVSWRSSVHYMDNIYFQEDYHNYFDARWYDILFSKYSYCEPNHILGQYKQFDKNLWENNIKEKWVLPHDL